MTLKTLLPAFCEKFTEMFKNIDTWFSPEEELPLYKLVVINRITNTSTTTYFDSVKEAVQSVYPKYLYDTKCDYMLFDNTTSKNASYINIKTNTYGSNTDQRFQSRFSNNKNVQPRAMERLASC